MTTVPDPVVLSEGASFHFHEANGNDVYVEVRDASGELVLVSESERVELAKAMLPATHYIVPKPKRTFVPAADINMPEARIPTTYHPSSHAAAGPIEVSRGSY